MNTTLSRPGGRTVPMAARAYSGLERLSVRLANAGGYRGSAPLTAACRHRPRVLAHK